MALVLSHFRFLLTQSDFFPVAVNGGKVLCLGVQDVHATHDQLAREMQAIKAPVHDIPVNERRYTESQVVPREKRQAHISDVFRMLGYAQVDTLDFSEAESPDIIHNLNEPISAELREQYDLVFDIGTVEHVCDIFQALSNCMALVKPGGVVLHIVPLHGWHNQTYFNFQPMFLQEVYAANGFEPTRTYINFYPPYNEWQDKPMLYREYRYGDEMIFQMPRKLTNVCFFARKKESLGEREFVRPIQGFYLRYHGETETPNATDEPLDGRLAAGVKHRLPSWLVRPLLQCNRFRLRLEETLLPNFLRERLHSFRQRRHLNALDRVRERKVFKI